MVSKLQSWGLRQVGVAPEAHLFPLNHSASPNSGDVGRQVPHCDLKAFDLSCEVASLSSLQALDFTFLPCPRPCSSDPTFPTAQARSGWSGLVWKNS